MQRPGRKRRVPAPAAAPAIAVRPAVGAHAGAVVSGVRGWRAEWRWWLPAVLAALLVYLNTLGGEFVYDDQRQIVRNTLIQDDAQLWRALTSDVWAFVGGAEPASNYWRPTFVAWMAGHIRLFGLHPFGWHVTNVLLHALVVGLAYGVLRRLAATPAVAGVIALVFAVHPVHSESVAWISGAPDLLLALGWLGSMLALARAREGERRLGAWGLAILAYVFALGAKEVAVLYPLLVLLWVWPVDPQATGARRRVWSWVAPFLGCALLYLVARHAVLGTWQQLPAGAPGVLDTLLTLPAAFLFYVRQVLLPVWIGPSYPLRMLTPETLGVGNFLLPLLGSALVLAWMAWQAWRCRFARLGAALFLLPLAPALHLAAFHPEQLVHDRYLYLPLLGALMLIVPPLARLVGRWQERMTRARGGLPALLLACAVLPLSAQTLLYNRAWTSQLALWEWGVRSDPDSAFNHQQLGVQLQQAGRAQEAVQVLNRAIALQPAVQAYLARAHALLALRQPAAAEADLRQILAGAPGQIAPYTLYQSHEALAIALTQRGAAAEAVAQLKTARSQLEGYHAALTEKLAVILYQTGQKQAALDELLAVVDRAGLEPLPESRLVWFRLGLLQAERGDRMAAQAAFQTFLQRTEGLQTPQLRQARAVVAKALQGR